MNSSSIEKLLQEVRNDHQHKEEEKQRLVECLEIISQKVSECLTLLSEKPTKSSKSRNRKKGVTSEEALKWAQEIRAEFPEISTGLLEGKLSQKAVEEGRSTKGLLARFRKAFEPQTKSTPLI